MLMNMNNMLHIFKACAIFTIAELNITREINICFYMKWINDT